MKLKTLFYIALLIGLFGTVTNLIFISPLPSILALAVLPYLFFRHSVIVLPRFIYYLYLYFLYSLAGILIYYPQSLLRFGFYRYDGNFIISYLPLLLISFFSYNVAVDSLFKRFLIFATVINGIAFGLNLVLTKGMAITDWGNPETYFHGFFKSTNGAGGFISIVLSLNIVLFLQERKRKWVLLMLINFVFLVATTSRGSLLGLVAGFAFYFFDRTNRAYLIRLALFGIVAVQCAVLSYTYPLYIQYVRDADLSEAGVSTYISPLFGEVSTKSANIAIRAVETWPRAVDCFLHSPLIGTGFGSVNDTPLKYQGVPYVISLNDQPKKVFNDAHAHHSYLHLLGEQGLIGLGIFLLFWHALYRFLKKGRDSIVQKFLLVSFFNLSVMSFTEHRITSPSNALPLVIALCIYMLKRNFDTKHRNPVVSISSVESNS
ncbi:O-antigen ligase family protein [Larkinella rosea]|uniref:O-antigen ligase domain-containing protein n=1 Tax=Larkinella rosea TaxID=2025312 RepID=A0A3P1BT30_9BACT|nr:O-antigen ligase family protein [Larkinella rosea]RRB04073.1 O-antigen ligase domain-containing protein [Larkinella rosea]